jgi:hypothetical protein
MEIRDGFIVSIFNYCDRWCETCAFTSRCRLFADMARVDAASDPMFKDVVEAPPWPRDIPPPPPQWLKELIEEANKAAEEPLANDELAKYEPRVLPEHESIHARAFDYCLYVHQWLEDRGARTRDDPKDPISVIAWFASLNSSKIFRALMGLAADDGTRDYPPDHDGSAKVAMLGIERSHGAWLQLVSDGRVPASAAEAPLAELVWLGEQLERVFPNARSFVRPGFDEPEEVARLK